MGSLGLLLAWCYLVPQDGWELEVPAAWGPAPREQRLTMTLHHYVSLEQTQTCMPGERGLGWQRSCVTAVRAVTAAVL
jgi:hypothetical protein